MIRVDWAFSAIAFTLSGILLIWIRSRLKFWKPKTERKSPNAYDESVQKNTYHKVLDLLREEAFYLNKNIKVADLAARLGLNEKLVSRAINKYGNGNFNAFINSFRIDHAKKLLSDGQHHHYTIEAIAEESGFSNKVSFYNAFKSDTGMSPKEYKEKQHPKPFNTL